MGCCNNSSEFRGLAYMMRYMAVLLLQGVFVFGCNNDFYSKWRTAVTVVIRAACQLFLYLNDAPLSATTATASNAVASSAHCLLAAVKDMLIPTGILWSNLMTVVYPLPITLHMLLHTCVVITLLIGSIPKVCNRITATACEQRYILGSVWPAVNQVGRVASLSFMQPLDESHLQALSPITKCHVSLRFLLLILCWLLSNMVQAVINGDFPPIWMYDLALPVVVLFLSIVLLQLGGFCWYIANAMSWL